MSVLGVAAALVQAQAGGPLKSMSQYVREHWGSDRGFPSGPVYAIAQTDDGYLWIGTSKGLIRFDGLKFHIFQQATDATAPVGAIEGLMADSQGNLWIRQQGAVLLRYRDGKFEYVLNAFEHTEVAVTAMARGADGRALFVGLVNGIVRDTPSGFVKLAAPPPLPNFIVVSIAEIPGGPILLGTRDAGLFEVSDGRVTAGPRELREQKINCLLAIDKQQAWIGTDSGLVRWDGDQIRNGSTPTSLIHSPILAMTTDRESNTWVGTSEGLFRITPAGVSALEDEGPRASGGVSAVFQDREGDLWTGSSDGLERLRDGDFITYSVAEGLPSESNGPLFVDSDLRTWFAPTDGGLYWLEDGLVHRVTVDGLDQDVVYSLAGGGGDLWIGRQRGGLSHLTFRNGKVVVETFTEAQGLGASSVYALHRSADGTVWAATLTGGVSRLQGGKISHYTAQNGLLSDSVVSMAESSGGTMWFATPKGLSSLSNGTWRSITSKDGLPSDDVTCVLEDSAGELLVGTSRGLALVRSRNVWRPEPGEIPEALREPVVQIAEDGVGGVWIATPNRIFRFDRKKWETGKLTSDDVREYDHSDGLRGTEVAKRNNSVVTDPRGRIWFSLNRGISVVDPSRRINQAVPMMVHVRDISADGNAVALQNDIRIPGPHRRVTIGFEGVNLSAPERVRFRYKLENFDRDWSEPGSEREATYTNLDSGSYRFRVMASNGDGDWNGSESTVQFRINPVFWQTWWFRLAIVGGVALAIWTIVRLRVLRMQQQMTMRFDERLAERTRIAHELHDTLLQGFLSASMQLHVADSQLSTDSPAKPLVTRTLALMGSVIDEGRNVLRGLRSPNRQPYDLEKAFATIPEEIQNPRAVNFRVIVEGTPRALRPAIRDEVYAIGREALMNAFHHAQANDIEVELEYATAHMRVLVRDDGCGIDQETLRSGRDGHWGLLTMRERAEKIGAKFRVLSAASAGTEVEVSISGIIAYEPEPSSANYPSNRRRNSSAPGRTEAEAPKITDERKA